MCANLTSTFENDLHEIILEYFVYGGYNNTSQCFLNEITEKGKQQPKELDAKYASLSKDLVGKFFSAFNRGDKYEFFSLWNGNLSEKLRQDDSVCQKLEFYCQIYFAIYPIKNNYQNKEAEVLSMQGFREFLENRGARLSKSTEFVRFYALPYVPNPKEHPSFCELFQESWVPGLEMRLKRFLELIFSPNKEPKLFKLYQRSNSDDDGVSLKQLQTKVVDSERRSTHYMKRLNQVQIDYHNLIGISAELVDLLEGSLQGIPVSPSHLQHVCQKLLVSQQHRLKSNGIPMNLSYDLSRPGTASMMLRQSIQLSNTPSISNGKKPTDAVLSKNPLKPKPLNFTKIKHDIEQSDEKTKLLLLQALRWRLTKMDVDSRNKLIQGLAQHDVLGVEPGNYHDAIFGILNGFPESDSIQQYLARFINAVATLCQGRSYLAKNSEICKLLMDSLKSLISKETVLRENLIGALQKLSLRRPIQTFMIKNGMIEWLMSLLEESADISDYTLDYSVALLMNLCLRTSGKKRCIEHKSRILKVLSKMLNTFNSEITSYVNGALYSILVMPEIREEAKALNMETTLRNFIKPDNPDMNRQLEYIINQLNSSDEPKVEDSEDEEEDDDEEDPEVMEVELDKDEIVTATEQELSGENLLITNYSQNSTQQKSRDQKGDVNPTISRPVTPGTYLNKRLSAVDVEQERPPTRSSSQLSENASRLNDDKNSMKSKQIADMPEYKQAFSSKPRVLRTPDQSNSKRSNVQSPTSPQLSAGNPVSTNGARKSRNSITVSTK